MRVRTLLLVIATALMALFVLLNWQEFIRPSTLSLGWQSVVAPLGLVMLGLLALASLVYLVASVTSQARYLAEARQHHRALQAQRDLAERAEASRFTDLRTQLEGHMRESRQRDTEAASQVQHAIERAQRELRNQLDQFQRSMVMRLGEMEARLEARVDPQRQALPVAEAERSRIARNPDYVRPAPLGDPSEPQPRSAAQREADAPAVRAPLEGER